MNITVKEDDIEITVIVEDLNLNWRSTSTISHYDYNHMLKHHGLNLIEEAKGRLVSMYFNENPITIEVEEWKE